MRLHSDSTPGDVVVHARQIFRSPQPLSTIGIRRRDGAEWGKPLGVEVQGDLFGVLVPVAQAPYRISLEVYNWRLDQFRGVSNLKSLSHTLMH